MARRRRTWPAIPRGISRWWVERRIADGLTMSEAIRLEQARALNAEQRIDTWKAN